MAGVEPQLRHLANSAATLTLPAAHFDLVRPGIAVYGLSPVREQYGLVPAMTVRGAAALVKRVHAGEGVSYGHEYTTTSDTTLVLVPLGYADGVPRHASNAGPVWVNGQRFTIAGRVCMDQIVVDVGDLPACRRVTRWCCSALVATASRPRRTGPTPLGTIHYEIVTAVGGLWPKSYR